MVEVMTGKDKGKRGKVLHILNEQKRLIVEGVNMVKRHRRARRAGEQGGIMEMEAPLHISNVLFVCPSCNKPTRVGVVFLEGKKVRVCKKCKEMVRADA
jgi:large subunit ribosomal protein L24